MVLNVLSPHSYILYSLFCVLPCRTVRPDAGAVTQAQLNRRYAPPEWDAASGASLLLNTAFVCFIFSPGLPLLLPVAALTFAVSYQVDRVALLRLYARPPMLSADVQRYAV